MSSASRSRGRRRSPYAPLATLLATHPLVARHLKHRRSPDRYEHVRITVASNPVPGCHIYGIHVVELDQLAAMDRGEAVEYLMIQDFFVYYPDGERPAKLYSGLGRNMRQFCELYRGPNGHGYDCQTDRTRGLVCGDHHKNVEQLARTREGRLHAAFNGAITRGRARLRVRAAGRSRRSGQ